MKYNPNVSVANPLAPEEEKKTEAFAKRVYGQIMGNFAMYKEKRNKRFFKWRKFAEGEQDEQDYLDMMTQDGKTLYQNISYQPSAIAKKFEESVVNGFMLRKEYPMTFALSKEIRDRKVRKKAEAQFRMESQDVINAISQEAGFSIEDPSAFIPEDIEDLELHFTLEDKEREELLMQEMVDFTLNDNNITALKKKFLRNIFEVNLSGLYNYIDANGRLIIEEIDAEDCIYSNSRKEDFSDISYAGRELRMYISDIRSMFAVPPEKEKQLFEAAKKYVGMYNNPTARLDSWIPDYRDMTERPYDNYLVDVVHLWWKCSKVIGYVEGKDRYGRTVFDTTSKLPDQKTKSEGRKKTGAKYVQTAYEGYFIKDGATVLKWGECRNIMRQGYDKEQVLCPFLFFMPGNAGKMLNSSIIDRITDYIRQMDIAELKIKQAIAKHPPDGYNIDIDSLMGVDLGDGELEPITLIDIWRQTGDFFYRSKKEGENLTENKAPIQPSLNHLTNTIQTYINVYNFNLSKIREVTGINDIADGSQTAPRVGYRFAEMQRQASNTATWSIYEAWTRIGAMLVKQIGTRIWDALTYGTPNKGYLGYLGKENIDFLKSREDLTKSSYDFRFAMGMDEGQRAALEQNVNAAIAAGVLEMPDAIRIMNVDDVYKAEKLAVYLYNKRRKEKEASAERLSRMSAESNAQAGVAVEQAKIQTYQIQVEGERAKEQQRKDADIALQLGKAASELILESFKTGKPLTPEAQMIVQAGFETMGLKAQLASDDTLRELERREAEDAMAAMQQQEAMQ